MKQNKPVGTVMALVGLGLMVAALFMTFEFYETTVAIGTEHSMRDPRVPSKGQFLPILGAYLGGGLLFGYGLFIRSPSAGQRK